MAYDIDKLENIENMDGLDTEDVNAIITLARESMSSLATANETINNNKKEIDTLKARNLVLAKTQSTGKEQTQQENDDDLIAKMFGLKK